jgi:predicted PurR-regulated permease PerM
MSHITHVVVILVSSIFLAYLLLPLVRFFENPIKIVIPAKIVFFRSLKFNLIREERCFNIKRKKWGRTVSIGVVYFILALFIATILAFVIPKATDEFNKFSASIPSLTQGIKQHIDEGIKWLEPKLPPGTADALPRTLQSITLQVESYTVSAISHTFTLARTVFSTAFTMIIIPLFTFYILMDVEIFKRAFMALIPKEKKEEAIGLLQEVDVMLGRYIRGQILICIVIGISITIALTAMGIEFSLLIGIFSGIVEVIPYLGVIIGMIPALLIALFTKGFWYALLLVVVLEAIHWTEGHIIVPAIMGHSVGLPPLVVIVALFIGGETMGLLGMFIAIPVAAIIRVVFNYYLRIYEAKHKETEEKKTQKLEQDNDIIC